MRNVTFSTKIRKLTLIVGMALALSTAALVAAPVSEAASLMLIGHVLRHERRSTQKTASTVVPYSRTGSLWTPSIR